MRKAMWMVMLGLLLVAGCSGGRVVEPAPATPSPEEEKAPKIVTNDPFEARLQRFEATYAELVCRANMNYDPTSTMGIIVEPWAEMQRFAGEKSTSLEPFLDILERNGYESLEAFAADRERIDQAKRGWWTDLMGRLFDLVEACNAAE
jgi:hypothetical protein